MYSSKFLSKEIQKQVGSLMEVNAIIGTMAVARVIVFKHPLKLKQSADRDFYQYCALEYVREAVRLYVNRFKLKPSLTPDPQLVLPGFVRLQVYYAVERDGDSLIIPIDQLSEDEISQKYAELIAMGDGCYEHANEFLRYHSARRKSA